MRLGYVIGPTRATAAHLTVASQPASINQHWTKAIAVDENRAVVWQVDASSGATRTFATGLRNPTALPFEPASRQL